MRCVHFVGFRPEGGQQYWNAVRVFGRPHFVHYHWDPRARREIADDDLVVFGVKGDPARPAKYNHDDSNEAGDPAAAERVYRPPRR